MPKLVKKRSKKTGLPPGALIHIGDKKTENVEITLIDYDEAQYQEREIKKIEECFPFKDKPVVTWLNINGIHDAEIMEKIGEYFGLHPLLLEDIMNTDQRPKIEDFGDYIFIILKMIYNNEKKNEIEIEQVSLILGLNFVISFQEKEGDVFNSIRERIRRGKGKMRKSGADYLAYSLMDAIVDSYFLILEGTGEKIEEMEEKLIANPTPKTLQGIHNLKRDMIFLRKSVWPLREVISGLERTESSLIEESTGIYLRDVYDHSIQVIDTIETFRDMISGMLDIYLSSISNKMNEVMKLLTIIATIFIPLTFIAGIYGMNFAYMPELQWRWGYFGVLFIMAVVSITMLIYFRKKKWL
ncbi:MAG: magnesium and cobalt transport protein CorA [Actinobacteria bacterium RBG_13_35_12]|uniref:Magnesium transport protein CorA n=1 Tax=Candidatus Sediminicultor quintus TaxID=1797291 RepID=A0A1F5A823_9BACT|nr:MAG: magnesium and cobalt transport protein CorA [Actinobacteria bacterium RBG_13_35_12]OGD13954.1 MAG: magnesium and cobalt transport protein CorA [Candidatus Atribacteria bacterium RBG_19FT_COMBO_35_14]